VEELFDHIRKRGQRALGENKKGLFLLNWLKILVVQTCKQLGYNDFLMLSPQSKTPTLMSKSPDRTWASTYAPKNLNPMPELLSVSYKGDTVCAQANPSCADFDK